MSIYNNAQLIVNSKDLSSYVRTLAYNESAEEVDDTAMGDDTRTSAGGLIRWTIEAELNQEFATSSGATPDNTLATVVGTAQSVQWRPTTTSTALNAANPKYTGSGLITEYVPMTGAVGDQKITNLSIVSAGTRTRAIAT